MGLSLYCPDLVQGTGMYEDLGTPSLPRLGLFIPAMLNASGPALLLCLYVMAPGMLTHLVVGFDRRLFLDFSAADMTRIPTYTSRVQP